MATKLATGIAKGEDSEKVAKEAVSQAKAKLDGGKIDLAMVYCSSKYDYQKVVNAVRATTNKAPLIGCSTAGEFTEAKIESGSIAVGLIASDEIKFFTAIAEGVREDPELVARSLANKLPGKIERYPNLTAILLVDGLAGVGEEMAVLTAHVFEQAFVEKVRFVGGAAGDDMQLKETFVFSGDEVATNSACICLLASKKPFFTNYILGLATEKEGEYKIRWPSGINEDGSLNFSCGIAEGSIFRIMDGSNLEDQINAAEEAARIAKRSAESAGHSDFAGIIVFDCAVRQLMLGDRFSESVNRFKKVLPGVPILGWETYGEIRLEPEQFSGFHNTTSVIMLLPNGEE